MKEDDCVDLNAIRVPWKKLFYALKAQGYLGPIKANEKFKKEVASLAERGIIQNKSVDLAGECMMISQVRFTPHEKVNF